MSDGEKKVIRILLVIIAISALILIVKMLLTPEYDPEVYAKVYEEYEEILDTNFATAENGSSEIGKKVTYKYVNAGNKSYVVDGEINIPKIHPVVRETTEQYLKVAPTKFAGPNMNTVGNYCIAGHNYKNNQFFSKLSQLQINDEVYLTSKSGRKVAYKVYAKYEVNETDFSCTNQETNGTMEATLITCTAQKDNRLVIKCRAC